ncbi:LysR family transcriptional regulator [Demequina salsinemoris]|uniref:LysR family transcriptional regulator n=1 Tax=Demequina salsinemoris TaxID=577470 RepID=UPI0007852015|nr:LysR family transcriptional regulator [Demequina salsinemoris]
MDLQSLKYFQFVAMYRNFSKAAEHFYIGQSALSRQIASLEKELGVQLFIRDTRNVHLTEAGNVLYENCDLLLRHHDLVYRLIDGAKSGHTGQLGIATVTNFGTAFTDLAERYAALYPGVKMRVDDIPFQELSESILHGIYDLAFTLDFEVPDNDQIAQVKVGSDRFVAAMREDYPCALEGEVTVAELLDQHLIMPSHVDPPFLRRLKLAARNTPGVQGSIEPVANTPTAVLRVDLGMGVTLLPERIFRTSFEKSRFKLCEITDLDTQFDLVAIYRRENQQQTLLNFLALIGQ